MVDKTQIEIVFKPPSGIPGHKEKFSEGLLRRALEPVVLGSLYPRTLLTVVVQVLHDDGGVWIINLHRILNCIPISVTLVGLRCS